VIKNSGGIDAIGVNWSITLDGGFVLLGKETRGRIVSIPAGREKTVSSSLIFGFGKTVVTVTAEKIGVSSDVKEQEAFVFLFVVTNNE
jgi:predicted aconitase with swiveling domain